MNNTRISVFSIDCHTAAVSLQSYIVNSFNKAILLLKGYDEETHEPVRGKTKMAACQLAIFFYKELDRRNICSSFNKTCLTSVFSVVYTGDAGDTSPLLSEMTIFVPCHILKACLFKHELKPHKIPS